MGDGSSRSALGVLASCVVHAVLVLGVHSQGSAREQTSPAPLWMELQIERRESEPNVARASEDRRDQPVQEPPVPAQPLAVARGSRTQRPRAAEQTAPELLEQTAPEPIEQASDRSDTPSAAPSEAPEGARAAPIDLSPLAAARTLRDSTFFPTQDAGASNPERPPASHTATANALANQVPGLRASRGSERSVEGVVVDAAEDAIYNGLRPWKLFQKTMRGSQYRYTGAGFDAAIMPNGQVRFRDKDGPALTVIQIQGPEHGPGSQVPPATTFGLTLGDLRSLFTRIRGKDPHAAERRTFLERTRALREYLSGRAAQPGALEPAESADGAEPQADPQIEPQVEPRTQRPTEPPDGAR